MKDSNYGKSKKTGDYYGKVFLSNNCGYYQITLANSTDRMRAVFLQTNTVLKSVFETDFEGGWASKLYPTTNRKKTEINFSIAFYFFSKAPSDFVT